MTLLDFDVSALRELHQRRLGPRRLTVSLRLEEERLVQSGLDRSDLRSDRNDSLLLSSGAKLLGNDSE